MNPVPNKEKPIPRLIMYIGIAICVLSIPVSVYYGSGSYGMVVVALGGIILIIGLLLDNDVI